MTASPAQSRHAAKKAAARQFLKSSKLARTRGPDFDHPVNQSNLEQIPVRKRRLGDLDELMRQRCQEAKTLAWAGATVPEIAEYFGVSEQTLRSWGVKHPQLLEAIKVGKEFADDRVETSLFRRAVEGENTAAIFWLKNRRPKDWRDKREIDLSADVELNDNTGTRELALAMLQMLREAVDEPVIDHEDREAAAEALVEYQQKGGKTLDEVRQELNVYTPAETRPRRRFE